MSATKSFLVSVLIVLFSSVAYAAPVTVEKARRAGETFLVSRFPAAEPNKEMTQTEKGSSTLKILDVTPLKTENTLVGYVVQLEPRGYILLSADDKAPPVKMYSENGSFDNLPPDFRAIIETELLEDLTSISAPAQKALTDTKFSEQWDSLLSPQDDSQALMGATALEDTALLTTAWKQGNPHNYYCPAVPNGGSGGRAYAGCGPVAIAQILRYHCFPPSVLIDHTYTDNWGDCTGTYSFSDVGMAYDWANMPAILTTSSTVAQKMAVGQLIFHCGIAFHVNYEADGSFFSGNPDSVLRTYFGYTCQNYELKSSYTSAQWYNKIAVDIEAHRPIYYHMWEPGAGYSHDMVCDGYRNGNEIHLNPGWGTNDNIWYNIDTFVGGGYTWTAAGAIFGITPPYSPFITTKLTNNTYAEGLPQISGTTAVWECRDGSDYEIYCRSGSTITKLTNNSYDDLEPQNYGSNIVWYGFDGTDYEIFYRTGSTTTQLTNNSYNDYCPKIFGSNIVWYGYDGHDYEIFYRSGSTTTQITNNSYDDINPQICSDGAIVWQGYDGHDYEIFYHKGSSTSQLTNNSYNDLGPQIDIAGITWYGFDGTDYEIFYRKGSTTTQLTNNSYYEYYPRISGSYVVWQGYDGSDYEIYYRKIGSTSNTKLTNNTYNDYGPEVSGSNIIWEGDDGDDSELFFYDGTTITKLTNNAYDEYNYHISGSNIVWQGEDNGVVNNESEIFMAMPKVYVKGGWLSGTTHAAVTGTNRALVFIAHSEDNDSPYIALNSVSYGGQAMTKVVERVVSSGTPATRAYVAAFILNETGITAAQNAGSSTFTVTWNQTPDATAYESAFLMNVKQTSLTGSYASKSQTSGNTITTSALTNNNGDLVLEAATSGNTGSYTANNGFTEVLDTSFAGVATSVGGYKSATGASETPSFTHSTTGQQVLVGFVVHRTE